MNILLLGKNGQVGWELQRALAPLGSVVALDLDDCGDLCGDLQDQEGLRRTLRTLKPAITVNAAAWTAVDKAEEEKEAATRINGLAPAILAEEIRRLNGWLIHYSSDYVYDGSGHLPWTETAPTGPLNHYGKSKLQGDEAIMASGCRHLIFRTSWVYARRGNNFAKTMLRLAREREILQVIEDQVGAPAGADLIADVTAHCLRSALKDETLSGLYHLAPSGTTSWHGYASFVVEKAREAGEILAVREIRPIPTSAYPTPAQRPLNSRLHTRKLETRFGLHLPSWQDGVHRMIQEITGKTS
ncbi:dTDP-4-dehydrorhamnose reductase [Desulfobotulus sp.]|uniref:dTDP-4-dehydrorhamnose reductase n=1 Tax=Desulfobotulus sp. TaxID=1940337 RepID=UPI002A3723F7|nr:dTDP-4-dehydrorhamnose reductase [Desulfobotulus sp.]MDY0164669.1 dTDP-4-dehydrorhamnose reductase [Desulfobotulus sp.]